jgi:hypothetical protein
MVKRHEYTRAFVVLRIDRFHRADVPLRHLVRAIEAVPTLAEAQAECERLNTVARNRGIDVEYDTSTCRWYPDGRGVVPAEAQPAAIAGTTVGAGSVAALLEALARWVGCDLDQVDTAALEQGLLDSDAGADRWFDQELPGEVHLVVRLARNVEAIAVSVQVGSDDVISDDLRVRIETALELFSGYQLGSPTTRD